MPWTFPSLYMYIHTYLPLMHTAAYLHVHTSVSLAWHPSIPSIAQVQYCTCKVCMYLRRWVGSGYSTFEARSKAMSCLLSVAFSSGARVQFLDWCPGLAWPGLAWSGLVWPGGNLPEAGEAAHLQLIPSPSPPLPSPVHLSSTVLYIRYVCRYPSRHACVPSHEGRGRGEGIHCIGQSKVE